MSRRIACSVPPGFRSNSRRVSQCHGHLLFNLYSATPHTSVVPEKSVPPVRRPFGCLSPAIDRGRNGVSGLIRPTNSRVLTRQAVEPAGPVFNPHLHACGTKALQRACQSLKQPAKPPEPRSSPHPPMPAHTPTHQPPAPSVPDRYRSPVPQRHTSQGSSASQAAAPAPGHHRRLPPAARSAHARLASSSNASGRAHPHPGLTSSAEAQHGIHPNRTRSQTAQQPQAARNHRRSSLSPPAGRCKLSNAHQVQPPCQSQSRKEGGERPENFACCSHSPDKPALARGKVSRARFCSALARCSILAGPFRDTEPCAASGQCSRRAVRRVTHAAAQPQAPRPANTAHRSQNDNRPRSSRADARTHLQVPAAPVTRPRPLRWSGASGCTWQPCGTGAGAQPQAAKPHGSGSPPTPAAPDRSALAPSPPAS